MATDNLLQGLLDIGGSVSNNHSSTAGRSLLRVVRLGRPVNIRSNLWNSTLDALLQQESLWIDSREKLDEAISSYVSVREESGSSGPEFGQAQRELGKARRMHECIESQVTEQLLRSADIIVSTCIGLGSEMLQSFVQSEGIRFNSVIVDEAAQCMV